jgi:hypothetical protein
MKIMLLIEGIKDHNLLANYIDSMTNMQKNSCYKNHCRYRLCHHIKAQIKLKCHNRDKNKEHKSETVLFTHC